MSYQYLSVGLLSFQFLKDANSQYLVSPLVSYELQGRRNLKEVTPSADHYLSFIQKYVSGIFSSVSELKTYFVNVIGDQGTHLFLSDLKQVQLSREKSIGEFYATESDIKLNQQLFEIDNLPLGENSIEISLKNYLRHLYVQYPPGMSVKLNGSLIDIKNPFDIIQQKQSESYVGIKAENFKIQIIKKDEVQSTQDLSLVKMNLQGMLLYRRNRLIRRVQGIFGSVANNFIPTDKKTIAVKKENEEDQLQTVEVYKLNGIVSVFQSKSQTSVDKNNITEQAIVKAIREHLKEYELANEGKQ
mmetsp:Transcript_7283/g.6428  ORF Transcript_7283/g.6428 Transcript_7283/m.6428 type:complete len:301 (+) Transcript_7283:2759-3661(+)